MKLKLRAAAVRDLDAIFDDGVEAHGADAASAYVRNLETAMDRLLAHPALGAPRDIKPGLRSIAEGEHRIFYRVEGKAIVVVRVLHKAMDVWSGICRGAEPARSKRSSAICQAGGPAASTAHRLVYRVTGKGAAQALEVAQCRCRY